MKNGKIVLNLYGNPSKTTPMCLSTGHGYYAYVSTNDTFIHNLFRDMCIWSGATDTWYDKNSGDCYKQYEMDCQDKAFFMSRSFKNICSKHNINLVICDEDLSVMRDFYDSIEH